MRRDDHDNTKPRNHPIQKPVKQSLASTEGVKRWAPTAEAQTDTTHQAAPNRELEHTLRREQKEGALHECFEVDYQKKRQIKNVR